MFALIFYRWLFEAEGILLNMDGVSCSYLVSKHFAQHAVKVNDSWVKYMLLKRCAKGYSNAVQNIIMQYYHVDLVKFYHLVE